jgi:HPt (histidine-containing phosphotransfer) domain-containing protein
MRVALKLNKFRTQFISEVSVFISLLNTHQLDKAKNWLHSLKGSAGNLGAHELYQATLSLETQLLKGQHSNEALNHWQTVFDQTMMTLTRLQNKSAPPIINFFKVFY